MESRIAIINVYFGKLPDWFQLWLNSCEKNNNFNWILFTDDNTEYKYPKNVIRYICSFEFVRKLIQKKLKLKIKVDNPYKLCDFKAVYGNIFEDYLENYTHWGYCDIDVIFGDLSKFITDEILQKYDRVLNKGHLTIYKNNKRVKEYYLLPYSGEGYKEVFESKYHYGFDETAGLDKLYRENNLSQYIPEKPIVADINFSNYSLKIIGHKNYKKQYFIWDNGRVLRVFKDHGKDKSDEFAYIHIQKRKIKVKNSSQEKYMFYPEGIIDIEKDIDLYKFNNVVLLKQIKKKYEYYKIVYKQKIYRFLHWKLKL